MSKPDKDPRPDMVFMMPLKIPTPVGAAKLELPNQGRMTAEAWDTMMDVIDAMRPAFVREPRRLALPPDPEDT